MHHPRHLYLSGIITGAIMGIFTSFFAYMMLSYMIGDVLNTTSGNQLLEIMITSTLLIGSIVGGVVSMFVHHITK